MGRPMVNRRYGSQLALITTACPNTCTLSKRCMANSKLELSTIDKRLALDSITAVSSSACKTNYREDKIVGSGSKHVEEPAKNPIHLNSLTCKLQERVNEAEDKSSVGAIILTKNNDTSSVSEF